MADMLDGQILEGMYSGIEEKIDEIKEELSVELQINATQIESSLKESLESMMNEVRYITQQNSAIYDLSKADINALKEDLDKSTNEQIEKAIGDIRAQIEELRQVADALSAGTPVENAETPAGQGVNLGEAVESINARVQFEVDSLKDELMGAMESLAMSISPSEGDNAVAGANTENFDAAVGALNDKFDAQANEVAGLKEELDTLKEELMGAMESLAMSITPNENTNVAVNTENFDAAVGALNEKFDTQKDEVTGLKGEFDSLKDELMGAMAQLAFSMTPNENAEAKTDDNFSAAVGALGEKFDAQTGEVADLRNEFYVLKDDLMGAMASLAMAVNPAEEEDKNKAGNEKIESAVGAIYNRLGDQATELGGLKEQMNELKAELNEALAGISANAASAENKTDREASVQAAENVGAQLRAEIAAMGDRMQSQFDALKDELMVAMESLAIAVTPDESRASDEKLEAAVGTLGAKLDTQADEVSGLKSELLEAMAQIGMAVSSAPAATNDFMSLKQELVKTKDTSEALEYQFDRAIDELNNRMQNEMEKLRRDLLGAVSDLEAKAGTNNRTETYAAGGESNEKLTAAVENLNNNLDTQVNALKDELLCAITQVGMAVFNAPDKNDFASFRDQISKSTTGAVGGDYEEKFGVMADSLNERIEEQMSGLKEEMLGAISQMQSAAPVREGATQGEAQINYDWLAEKLAQKVPAIDYDFMAERVKEMLPEQLVDYDTIVERIKEIIPEQTIDYDFMAERVKEILPEQPAAENAGVTANASRKSADEEPFEIDYDLLAEKIAIIIPEVDYDELADRIANMIPQADENAIADRVASVIPQTDESEIADKVADAIPLVDYDLIAAKVAEKLADEGLEPNAKGENQEKVDYDTIAERLAQKVGGGNYFSFTDRIAANGGEDGGEIDYDLLADKVAQRVPAVDYDELAQRVAAAAVGGNGTVEIDYDELAEHMHVSASEAPAPEMNVDYDLLAEILAQKVPAVDYDEIAERVKAAVDFVGTESGSIDYDAIAERVSLVVPELDYDTIAERVKAAVDFRGANAEVDYDALALRVARMIPTVNYDMIADRVARLLENEFDVTVDDAGITKIARTVSEEIDYSKVAETVVDMLKKEELFKKSAPEAEKEVKETKAPKATEEEATIASAPQQPFAPAYNYAPQPAYNYAPQPALQPAYNYAPQPNYNFAPAPQPAPQQPQPAPQQPQPAPAPKFPFGGKSEKPKPAKPKAPSAKPAPIADEEEENEQTTRFKRSFIARIIQSDDETKNYYGKLKNAILQYARTSSQVNWSNDRFSYAGETIVKIGINGKSLCMYIALDPEEFSTSVYHQKYEGDKKMYEKTPMMVKIKSEVGLKRALRLIPLLMEKLGAVAGEKKNVDYVSQYPYKTDDELLEEGLIKMQTTAKTGFNF